MAVRLEPYIAEQVDDFHWPSEIEDAAGDLLPVMSIDDLINAYEVLQIQSRKVYGLMRMIKNRLHYLTDLEGITTQTRRVRGARRSAKLQMPQEIRYEQKAMKRAYTMPEWQAFVRDFIRVQSLAPNVREVKKLFSATVEDPNLRNFRDFLLSAHPGPAGTASLSIEE